MKELLIGAVAMASLIAAMFFLRFWHNTRDRLFLYFAFSFGIEGVNRVVLGLTGNPDEDRPFFYFVRFISFLLIIIAIVEKNFASKPGDPSV
ncbi:MAG TPA: DUF5985 family protein [Verrucomicrobiae bacterium]|nr:DUF5985 family protein [Verrucomicrobiae bacterium]